MNEDFKFAFSNVNDWLKFAEAKNAGLLALNVASIIGILQANDTFFKALPWSRGLLIILFCVSSASCLYSILPQLNLWFKFYKKMGTAKFAAEKSKINLLFFGHLAELSCDQLIELYKERTPVVVISRLDEDLALQIIKNAEIAMQKFNVFKLSCWLTVIASILAAVLVIINGTL